MPKSSDFANKLLLAIFNAIGIPNLLDNTATSPATTLTVALHTADPTPAGVQTASEIAYTGYARQTVARSSAGWTVTANSVAPVANIDFPAMTGGAGGTVTFFSVGDGVSNEVLYSGPVTPSIVVVNSVVPRLTPATAITEA
jgi:hypothetical protein